MTNNFASSGVGDLLERHYEGDVVDPSNLLRALEETQPAVIFHLAAQTLVRQSHREPRRTFEVNAIGTLNLLEAVRQLKLRCAVIVVTSDKCYENRGRQKPLCESDPLGGGDPYSASKAAAEIITAAYRKSFSPPSEIWRHGVQIATVRAGNAIGGGDWAADRIVPDTVRALMADRPVSLRNPKSIRPWQHVLEPLAGYLHLAERMLAEKNATLSAAWNFGPYPAKGKTVQDLVEAFIWTWGSGAWNEVSDQPGPAEAMALRLSIKKTTDELGWKPRWSFEETVARTARWYRDYYQDPHQSSLSLCLRDIADYGAIESFKSAEVSYA